VVGDVAGFAAIRRTFLRRSGFVRFASVMDAVRLRSRVFCRSELRAPWGPALPRSDYAHFHVIERGGA
jgi:hypothetical protein